MISNSKSHAEISESIQVFLRKVLKHNKVVLNENRNFRLILIEGLVKKKLMISWLEHSHFANIL